MSNTGSDPDTCPRDGCNGEIGSEMVGDAANPRTKNYCEKCNSTIDWCVECMSPVIAAEATSRWSHSGEMIGQDHKVYWCESCEDEIPDEWGGR